MSENLQTGTTEFTPPRHWMGLEELSESYWQNEAAQEKRSQEFYEKPIEVIDAIDKLDQKGIARRDFLTIMGASIALASTACMRRPVHKIIPYVVKPEEITPGIANWYASSVSFGSYSSGVLIKTREGRPIKLEGNPDHPVNQGALGVYEQACLLDLYDQDRLQEPLTRGKAGEVAVPSDWMSIDQKIAGVLKGASTVRVLSSPVTSDATRELVGDFLKSFKDGKLVEVDVLADDAVLAAQNASYGTAVVPTYHFDKAHLVVSLGADFLGTWLSPEEFSKDWVKGRKLTAKNSVEAMGADLTKLVVFESMMSVTGGMADERFAILPGDEIKIAMALLNQLILVDKRSSQTNDAFNKVLASYSPAQAPVPASVIKELANHLWHHKGESLVVAGGISTQCKNAVGLQVAVNLLNSILGNDGVTVDGTANPHIAHGNSFEDLKDLVKDMNAGKVDVLIVNRTNPVYNLPQAAGFVPALAKVKTVISITDRDDETAQYATAVLPDHHFLENWSDAHTRKGIYSIQQPAIAPLFKTRSFQDSVITWSKAASLKLRTGFGETWHDYLKDYWKRTHFAKHGKGQSFEKFWETCLQKGVIAEETGRGSARTFKPQALSEVPANSLDTHDAFKAKLVMYSKVAMRDGSSANNAWLQEMPDPITTVTWDNYACISPTLAKSLSVNLGDVIEVRMGTLKMELPVYIQVGLHTHTVAVAVGYGRTHVGHVGNGCGVNAFPFVSFTANHNMVYAGEVVDVRKTGRYYKLARTQEHNYSMERPIISDVSLATYKKNPAAASMTDPPLKMKEVPTIWPVHEYTGHKWGMVIDLNSCTGCGACVIACQAENNIPVVGRDNVRKSREMHWIRIDRYYSGSPENPEVVFQPMLCQHCDNAPCETVCPVLATVHSPEGINEQVYNRCVGTRYCQNNCPYKVRRFNFFDHWKDYKGVQNYVWNPDVTVRTRGIMEKCTFCVQRIRDVKDKAAIAKRKIVDGEIQPACVQTCPTDAIVFGDVNNKDSQVAKHRLNPRAFKVLEANNVQPAISYLSRVRNRADHELGKEGGSHHG